jgi:hypothetical protein
MPTLARLITALALLVAAIGADSSAQESAASRSDVALSFPQGVTITTTIPASDITDGSVSLLWRPAFADVETISPATLERDGAETIATVTLDLQQQFTPVGVSVEYRWVTGSESVTQIGDSETFDWHDTRWSWNAVSSGMVTVHTFSDASADSRAVLDSATTTLETIKARYGATLTHPISIWVYPTMTDFAGTLQANSREAVAGVAYPEYGVISSILPAGQPAEIERVIPHEISHQALTQATANPWNYPPLWFDEGLAVYLQTGGKVSYDRMLERAGVDQPLFALDSLGYAFPYAPADAALAYAESWSVVSWLHNTYGDEGIARLIEAFATGSSWDASINDALGTDLETIERDWRADLLARAPDGSARLVSETNHGVPQGPATSPHAPPSQESPQWLSIPASNTEPAFSIRLRSSASWR